jgi:hypothetical protein
MYMPNDLMENGRGLDDRSRLDLFVSQTHLRVYQDNKLFYETDIPAGSMPWFNRPLKAYYTHYAYHTDVDIIDLSSFQLSGGSFCFPLNSYWFNNPVTGTAAGQTGCNTAYPAGYGFPHSDERHWDNMGFEVLPDFSSAQAASQLQAVQLPQFVGGPNPTPPPGVTPAATLLVPTATAIPASRCLAVLSLNGTPTTFTRPLTDCTNQ